MTDRQLSGEFAENVDLSLNPWRRHQQVTEMLGDQALTGSDLWVDVEALTVGGERFSADMTIYGAGSIRPFKHFLGRGTLKRIAEFADYVEARNAESAQ